MPLIKPVFCPSCNKIKNKNPKINQPSLSVYTLSIPCPSPGATILQHPTIRWLAAGHHCAQYSNPEIISGKRETVSRESPSSVPCNLKSETPSVLLLNSWRIQASKINDLCQLWNTLKHTLETFTNFKSDRLKPLATKFCFFPSAIREKFHSHLQWRIWVFFWTSSSKPHQPATDWF